METEHAHLLPEAELRHFAQAVLGAAGLGPEDAATVADSIVSADLRGTHSHGVIRLPFLVERLQKGGARSQPEIKTVNDAPATALLDGDHALGAITATHAMELAITKARSQGIGLVTKTPRLKRISSWTTPCRKALILLTRLKCTQCRPRQKLIQKPSLLLAHG